MKHYSLGQRWWRGDHHCPATILTTESCFKDYIAPKCCDQRAVSADNDVKPPRTQSSPSRMTARVTDCTSEAGLPNTLLFLSFQTDQATSSSMESNIGRAAKSIQRCCRKHHEPKSSLRSGISVTNCSGASSANHTCLAKTQPRNR